MNHTHDIHSTDSTSESVLALMEYSNSEYTRVQLPLTREQLPLTAPNSDELSWAHAKHRTVANSAAHALAVSGTRGVAAVYLSKHKKLLLFDMEADDEDEEEDVEGNVEEGNAEEGTNDGEEGASEDV
jgi:hypothetical protein